MKQSKFKSLEHEADIKFKISANSFKEIFENATLAFSDYISSGKKIKSIKKKSVKIESDNKESLFYKFIDELIFLLDAENFAVSKAEVKIDNLSLKAILFGDTTKNYDLKHVKAATYAEMYIKNSGKNWEAQLVIDV